MSAFRVFHGAKSILSRFAINCLHIKAFSQSTVDISWSVFPFLSNILSLSRMIPGRRRAPFVWAVPLVSVTKRLRIQGITRFIEVGTFIARNRMYLPPILRLAMLIRTETTNANNNFTKSSIVLYTQARACMFHISTIIQLIL